MKPHPPFDFTPQSQGGPNPPPENSPHRRAAKLVMVCFLASLTMLFGASVVGYLVIRHTSPAAPPPGSIQMPAGLWASTVLLLAAGGTMHLAQRHAARGQMRQLTVAILLTAGLSAGFLLVQIPCLAAIYGQYEQSGVMYGLVLTLIVIHALHLIGGFVPLAVVTARAVRRRYTATNCDGVKYCAAYWHFLELVWIVLFGMFLVTG